MVPGLSHFLLVLSLHVRHYFRPDISLIDLREKLWKDGAIPPGGKGVSDGLMAAVEGAEDVTEEDDHFLASAYPVEPLAVG